MKLLYATGNPAKLATMRSMLRGLDLEILGLEDVDCAVGDVDESGNDPLENARLKARAYYRAIGVPLFSCDSGLYIEDLPEAEQPGVHVRMVGGRRLTDKEMIAHYGAVARRMGGRAVVRYRNAVCLIVGEGEETGYFGEDIASEPFLLLPRPHRRRVEGFPLDSLSARLDTGEYYYDWKAAGGEGGMIQAEGFRRFFLRSLWGKIPLAPVADLAAGIR